LLLLIHNYGHLNISHFFTHWWPLLIIFWGLVKLYERTAGRKFGGGGGGITAGEVLLVFGMLALLGTVTAVDLVKTKIDVDDWGGGNSYTFDDLEVPTQAIPLAPVSMYVLVAATWCCALRMTSNYA
jgi:hypothetical protein